MNRLYDIVDTMHKEANLLSEAGKLMSNNMTATAGGVLGGAYGAYKGSQGENGGLKGALVGGLQGAAGGAIAGHVGARLKNSVMGQDSVFKQYGAARKRLLDDANVAEANRGFFSRNFGEGRKQISTYKKSQEDAVANIKHEASKVIDREGSGLITAKEGRDQIDALYNSNPLTQLAAARQKMLYGTIGAGVAGYTVSQLMSGAANAGQGTSDEQRLQNLRAKYQQTGQLDPREMNMLTSMLNKSQTQSSAV
jgi:hypothetical protein